MIDDASQRPRPAPEDPWTNAQSWIDLCLLRGRVDEAQLRKLVPGSAELETHDGSAWLGITPFESPVPLPDEEPHVMFCPRQDMVLWSLDEVE